MKDLAKAHTLLKSQPYQCHLCGTGVIVYPKHVLEHLNTTRHKNSCSRHKVTIDCTSPDGSSCLTSEVKDCLFTTITREHKAVPAQNDPLNISTARLSSSLAPWQLSVLCDHVEDIAQTLNVKGVSSLLSQHDFQETTWLHLEDNSTRVKALCVHIMRTNNVALFQALYLHFERRRDEYEEICRLFQDSSSSDKRDEPLLPISQNEHILSAKQEATIILRTKVEQMSSELEHYRRLQFQAAHVSNSFEEQWKSLSTLIQDQSQALKNDSSKADENSCLNHMKHYLELILKSSTETVRNPTNWLPLWPSPEGVYPPVDWSALEDSSGKVITMWRQMIAARNGGIQKLAVPQLRLASSVCRAVRLVALNLHLERKDSSMTLCGVPLADVNSLSCNLHMKCRLSLPTSDGSYRVLRRDSLVFLETGSECKMVSFGDLSWNVMDPERLPQLCITLLPVDSADMKWWWCDMPPVRPDERGVYPTVDWGSLGGDSDWDNVWQHMITSGECNGRWNNFNSLYTPPMYLPGASRRVVKMYLGRRLPRFITFRISYHQDLRGVNKPFIANTFHIEMELIIHMRNALPIERRNKISTKVTLSSDKAGIVSLPVENWNMLDPHVLPVLNVTITDVN